MKKLLLLIVPFLFLTACSLKDDSSGMLGTNAGRLFLGNENAPVVIEEFSDLQCPACAQISPQVEEVVRNNPDVAKLYFYHFPLPQHQYAFIAAEASECAADQGKFWEYMDLVFQNQNGLSQDLLYSLASQLSLDTAGFRDCLDTHQHKDKVNADSMEARRRGTNATPTLYVNGQKVSFGNATIFEEYILSLTNQ